MIVLLAVINFNISFKIVLCLVWCIQLSKLKKVKADQENLPIFQHKSEIVELVRDNQVVIIAGDTGCGKSTQVFWCLLLPKLMSLLSLWQMYLGIPIPTFMQTWSLGHGHRYFNFYSYSNFAALVNLANLLCYFNFYFNSILATLSLSQIYSSISIPTLMQTLQLLSLWQIYSIILISTLTQTC
jgi:hypothetical protein